MRLRTWHMLVFILFLTLLAGWIVLPGSTLDLGGFKKNHPVREGLDLQGGLQVLLQANPPAGQTVDKDTLAGTRDTIERRVNALGVSEPLIQTRGNNQIVVELPGIKDPQDAIATLKDTALLEIIDPQGQQLPVGTVVRTTLGEPGQNGAATPAASPAASPGACPI